MKQPKPLSFRIGRRTFILGFARQAWIVGPVTFSHHGQTTCLLLHAGPLFAVVCTLPRRA